MHVFNNLIYIFPTNITTYYNFFDELPTAKNVGQGDLSFEKISTFDYLTN